MKQDELTPREYELLVLVLRGKQNKEIATTLCISIHTVENHLHNIYRKLGVRTRTKAVYEAMHRRIIVSENSGDHPG